MTPPETVTGALVAARDAKLSARKYRNSTTPDAGKSAVKVPVICPLGRYIQLPPTSASPLSGAPAMKRPTQASAPKPAGSVTVAVTADPGAPLLALTAIEGAPPGGGGGATTSLITISGLDAASSAKVSVR
jgi:hypothetical protein